MRIELDDGNLLVCRQLRVDLLTRILHVLIQLFARQAACIHFVVVRADERHQPVILLLQHERLEHKGHVIDLRLDLLGIDILSACAQEHGLATSLDEQESVFIEHT